VQLTRTHAHTHAPPPSKNRGDEGA
jgi:hypothetical protein